jgi:hypothetical protein
VAKEVWRPSELGKAVTKNFCEYVDEREGDCSFLLPPPCEVGISGDGEWTLSGVGCRRRDNKNSFFFGGGCQRLPTILALKMATAMSVKTLDNFQQSTWIILEIGNYNISLNIAI